MHEEHVNRVTQEVVGVRVNVARTENSHFVNAVPTTERRCHVAHLAAHPDREYKARSEFSLPDLGTNKSFLQAHLAKIVEALDCPDAAERKSLLVELESCADDNDVSHRCHNKHCIRASHLAVMSRHNNQQASRCITAILMNCGKTANQHVDEDHCSSPCALHHPGTATCLV